MTKRIISLILSITLVFSVLCPAVHADGSADFGSCSHDWQTPIVHGYSITIPNSDISFGVEFQQCSKCHWYKHDASLFIVSATYYSPLAPDLNGIVPTELITYWCNKYYEVFGKNATAKKYETGGGSAGTGGVGRRPSGYSENNMPDVSNTGLLHFYAPVTGWTRAKNSFDGCSFWSSNRITALEVPSANATGTKFPSSVSSSAYVVAVCAFTAPVSGTYSTLPGNVIGKFRYIMGNKWYVGLHTSSSATGAYAKGDSAWLVVGCSRSASAYPYDAVGYGADIYVAPLESTIKPSNSITINQNVWNGNIYQDNSTNLTYIYPQYTTINEKNETVTNISNNPIIYNNETKQYYTYDTVTNNYYYITYEAPTPSPSPDPTPTPDPGTDPTPTPKPGGDTGDTTGILAVLVEIRDNMVQGFLDLKATLVQGWADLSANFTLAIENLNINIKNYFDKKLPDQSTPETAKPSPSPSPSPEPSPSPTPDPGETPTPTPAPTDKPNSGNTNNFWNFVFPGGSDDGTENGHKGILWALISLLIAVVTFVLGLGSAYAYVFPFLPAGLVTTIHICVLVLLLFAIIKFVRSFL